MKRTHGITLLLALAMGAAAPLAASAAPLKIELPPDIARLKPGPGADNTSRQCLTCHSADYIITQPRDKPRAFWKAEVEKMKKVYGAPIPNDQIEPLTDYLVRNYGTGK